MGNCKWASEAEDFLKKFRKEFEGKKLALFVSTMKPFLKEKERWMTLQKHERLP